MSNVKEILADTEDKLKEKFNYQNVHQIPKIEKIIIHRRLGEALTNSAVLEKTYELFYSISGQKPVFTKAKKSISNFKLREGQVIGCKVTLRNKKMFNFLTNLINLSLPKIRDFRGVSRKGFDKFGNYSFGIKDDTIFPESKTELDKQRGMDITICTTAKSSDECRYLLELIGIPFTIINQ